MGSVPGPLTPKQTLLLIWLPMLATFAGQRLHLHLGGVQHVYPAGYLVHHLYPGTLIAIPAAFVLAFSISTVRLSSLRVVRVALAVAPGAAVAAGTLRFPGASGRCVPPRYAAALG